MRAHQFPGCCTAQIVEGFGGSIYAEDGAYSNSMEHHRRSIAERMQLIGGTQMVMAISNNEQKELNEALRQLEFRHSTWIEKTQHRGSRIRIWWSEPIRMLNDPAYLRKINSYAQWRRTG